MIKITAGILHSRPPGPQPEYRKRLFVICPSSPAGSMWPASATDAHVVQCIMTRMILKNTVHRQWKMT
eukprot:scaffold628745_cov22-Prasinocladus_malaysianus.AAC.1